MAELDGTAPARIGRSSARRKRRAGPPLPTLRTRPGRYLLFFATYLYQGLVAGFSLTALANHLAARGVSAGEVGAHLALAGLPWAVQPVLWGPLIDRSAGAAMGRRRVWAAASALGCQGALLLLLLLPGPEALGALSLVFLLHSLFAALLDTSCDRMILDHVPEGELGRVSACTRAGLVVGSSLGAGVFGWLLTEQGFAASVRWLLAAGLLATLPVLLVREAPGDAWLSLARRAPAPRAVPLRRFLRRLAVQVRRPRALRLLALCFALDASLALFELPFTVDLVQGQGWEAAALSRLQAGLALAGGTVGALAIGVWSDRAGPLKPLAGLCGASAGALLLTGGLIAAGLAGPAGPLILALTGILPGLIVVALVPALMRASRGRPGAATQFELYMAAMNFGSVSGAAVSGQLASLLPLALVAGLAALVFAGAAALAGRCGALFPAADPRETVDAPAGALRPERSGVP